MKDETITAKIEQLKKQLEEYKKKLTIATKMEMKEIDKNTFVGIDYFQGKCIIYETQQKAFIKFLENELLDARYYARDIAHYIEYVLRKYKKLIGVSDEKEN